jgi:hypothetical protein
VDVVIVQAIEVEDVIHPLVLRAKNLLLNDLFIIKIKIIIITSLSSKNTSEKNFGSC